MTALFAVTTGIFFSKAEEISVLASSVPPINSTRTSISSSKTSNTSLKIFVSPGLYFGLSLRAPMATISRSTW